MMLKRQYYLKKNDKSNRIEKQQSRFTVTPNETASLHMLLSSQKELSSQHLLQNTTIKHC